MTPKTNKQKLIFFIILAVDAGLLALCLLQIIHPIFHWGNFAVLNPQGIIANKEKQLLITALLIMAIVVIPVFILLFLILYKYRADKNQTDYSPNMQTTPGITLLLWLIPVMIIGTLGVINWQSTHELDPYKKLDSKVKPLTIQVVALNWKWLFIYPEQNIASVNSIYIPENTPIHFLLTSDAPMNSFWIPQLGGQMYAMAGMETQLNLMASQTGVFNGGAAEINGEGFSGMRFKANAVSAKDFDTWVKLVKSSNNILSYNVYSKLAEPSENNKPEFYGMVEENLFSKIIEKFMSPKKMAD